MQRSGTYSPDCTAKLDNVEHMHTPCIIVVAEICVLVSGLAVSRSGDVTMK